MPTLRLALTAAILLAASSAMAQSRVTYQANNGVQPNHPSMVTARLSFICYGDEAGTTITGQGDCGPMQNCNAGAVCGVGGSPPYYRVQYVPPTATNEERVGGYCASDVAGDPIRDFCLNEPLVITMRMKVANMIIDMVGEDDGKPVIEDSGYNLRFYVGTDNRYYQTGPDGADYFPIGSWTPVVNGTPTGQCRPVPINTTPTFVVQDIPGQQRFEWLWRGTECELNVSHGTGGGTIIDLNSSYTCAMPAGQFTNCEFIVPYGQVARFKAVGDSGFVGSFARNGGPCVFSEPDETVCEWTPRDDRSLSLTWQAVSTSATMTASAGSASPSGGEVAKGASDVVVQQVHVAATGSPAINQVVLNMTGTGSTADITGVKVYVDANNNGAIDAGEVVAGQGSMASTGLAPVSFASALAVGSGVNLIVAVGVAQTIQAGVNIPGAPWTLLLIVALPVAFVLRRRAPALAVAVMTLVVAASLACGSGSSNDDTNTDNDQQGDSNNTDNDTTDDGGDNDVNPQAKTYAFTISAVTGTETVSGGPAVIASGVPLAGATISVMP